MSGWFFNTRDFHAYSYWEDAFSPLECESIVKMGLEKGLSSGLAIDETVKKIRHSSVSWIGVSKESDWIYNIPRKLSLVLQLSDPKDYEGGELILHLSEEPTVVPKKQGYVTIFPSFVLHEVTPVTSGTRHSLVSWISGKPFV